MKPITDEKKDARAAYLLLALFVLSLIPLYVLGLYAHPCADDYFYGMETAAVWRSTHSMGEVLRTAWAQMLDSYQTWQGNYAAIFLMRLHPGVFADGSAAGSGLYGLTTVILLTSFAAATVFFFFTAARKMLGASRFQALSIALVIAFGAIQFCYKPSDAFYWFNGGSYYTLFCAISFVLYAWILWVMRAPRRSGRVAGFLLALPAAFLVGGGNYSTALYTAVILSCLVVFLFIKKQKSAWPVLVIFIVEVGALLLSVIAPGNAVRQGAAGESVGVIKALIYSFAYGGYSLANSLNVPTLLLWLALTPLLYKLAAKTHFRFKYPLLVLIFTFGIYCSQGTALFYARGLRMPPRMSDIIYFNSFLLVGFNLSYILGWVHRRFAGGAFAALCDRLNEKPKWYARFAWLIALAFVVGCVGLCRVSEGADGGAEFSLQPASVGAAYALVTGQARQYDAEMDSRESFLEAQPDGASVTVPPISVYPEVLVHAELSTDPTYFINDFLAKHYGLSEIVLGE